MGYLASDVVQQYTVNGREYLLYGCYSESTPEGEYDFFDLYDDEGNCLNEGNPFDSMLPQDELEAFLDSLREARLP